MAAIGRARNTPVTGPVPGNSMCFMVRSPTTSRAMGSTPGLFAREMLPSPCRSLKPAPWHLPAWPLHSGRQSVESLEPLALQPWVASRPQMKRPLRVSRAFSLLQQPPGAISPQTSSHGHRDLANLGLPQLGPFDVGTGAARIDRHGHGHVHHVKLIDGFHA
jgi:hypothetical protein